MGKTMLILSFVLALLSADPAQSSEIKFYYAIEKSAGQTIIFIEPVTHWETDHCLADHYSDQEYEALQPIFAALPIVESMESTYEWQGPKLRIRELRTRLEAAGLIPNQEFQEFIRSTI